MKNGVMEYIPQISAHSQVSGCGQKYANLQGGWQYDVYYS